MNQSKPMGPVRPLLWTLSTAVVVALATVCAPALAQRRRPTTSPAAALREYEEIEHALRDLVALQPQPGDADGAVRAWDRRWAARMAAAHRRSSCPRIGSHECGDVAVRELACNAAYYLVLSPRDGLLQGFDGEWAERAQEAAAARRAVAEEAMRREREGMSCEDVPNGFSVVSETVGDEVRWYNHGGEPLRAGGYQQSAAAGVDRAPGSQEQDSGVPHAITVEELRESVLAARAGMQECWHRAVRDETDVQSVRVEVSLMIERGAVTRAIAIADGAPADLLECVEARTRSMQFRESSQTTRSRFPLAFEAP